MILWNAVAFLSACNINFACINDLTVGVTAYMVRTIVHIKGHHCYDGIVLGH